MAAIVVHDPQSGTDGKVRSSRRHAFPPSPPPFPLRPPRFLARFALAARLRHRDRFVAFSVVLVRAFRRFVPAAPGSLRRFPSPSIPPFSSCVFPSLRRFVASSLLPCATP
jgi:hypothetical protein